MECKKEVVDVVDVVDLTADDKADMKPNCLRCKEYFSEENMCSKCKSLIDYENNEYTAADYKRVEISTTTGYLVQRFISEHYVDLFKTFSTKFRLLKGNEFVVLRVQHQAWMKEDAYENKMIQFFTGQGDHFSFPIALKSDQAMTLFSHYKVDRDIPSQIVHMIGSLIIDPWNVKTQNGVLMCYHLEFGEMQVPRSLDHLKRLWDKFLRPNICWGPGGIFNWGEFQCHSVGECVICCENMLFGGVWQCPHCFKMLHVRCKLKFNSKPCCFCKQ